MQQIVPIPSAAAVLKIMRFLLSLIVLVCYITNVRGTATNHRVIVGGATGYIGRNVVKQLVSRGITTAALVRSDPSQLSDISLKYLQGAEIIQCDVLDPTSTDHSFLSFQPTAVICCLASRSGMTNDVQYQIDNHLSHLSVASAELCPCHTL